MKQAGADMKIIAVTNYLNGNKTANEICFLHGITDRTLRRWVAAFKERGVASLQRKKSSKRVHNQTPARLEQRILRLKQKNVSWGGRRIKNQYGLPVHWTTVHRVIKNHGLLVRIKAKPQPCKRFQRKHVDSMWQGDTFEFRIHGVGKVYVTGFTDDCSRYRVAGKTYLHKNADNAVNALRWALKRGRKPREVYLDNGKQFIAAAFKREVVEVNKAKLIYGKPGNARGRGKIEAYHKILYRELVSRKRFKSLSHFRRELWKFDRKYNFWRKQESLGWRTPASVYFNKKYFNKRVLKRKKRTFPLLTN